MTNPVNCQSQQQLTYKDGATITQPPGAAREPGTSRFNQFDVSQRHETIPTEGMQSKPETTSEIKPLWDMFASINPQQPSSAKPISQVSYQQKSGKEKTLMELYCSIKKDPKIEGLINAFHDMATDPKFYTLKNHIIDIYGNKIRKGEQNLMEPACFYALQELIDHCDHELFVLNAIDKNSLEAEANKYLQAAFSVSDLHKKYRKNNPDLHKLAHVQAIGTMHVNGKMIEIKKSASEDHNKTIFRNLFANYIKQNLDRNQLSEDISLNPILLKHLIALLIINREKCLTIGMMQKNIKQIKKIIHYTDSIIDKKNSKQDQEHISELIDSYSRGRIHTEVNVLQQVKYCEDIRTEISNREDEDSEYQEVVLSLSRQPCSRCMKVVIPALGDEIESIFKINDKKSRLIIVASSATVVFSQSKTNSFGYLGFSKHNIRFIPLDPPATHVNLSLENIPGVFYCPTIIETKKNQAENNQTTMQSIDKGENPDKKPFNLLNILSTLERSPLAHGSEPESTPFGAKQGIQIMPPQTFDNQSDKWADEDVDEDVKARKAPDSWDEDEL